MKKKEAEFMLSLFFNIRNAGFSGYIHLIQFQAIQIS